MKRSKRKGTKIESVLIRDGKVLVFLTEGYVTVDSSRRSDYLVSYTRPEGTKTKTEFIK